MKSGRAAEGGNGEDGRKARNAAGAEEKAGAGGDEYYEGGPVLRNVRSDEFGEWRFSAFTRGTFVGNREIFAAPKIEKSR